MPIRRIVALLCALGVLAALLLAPPVSATGDPSTSGSGGGHGGGGHGPPGHGGGPGGSNGSHRLREAVTLEGVTEHLDALQAVADANGSTRASGTPGYEASRDYVVEQLEAAGYHPEVQEFLFPYFQVLSAPTFEQTSPTARTFAEGTDYTLTDFSGAGDVTGTVQEANDNVLPPGPDPSTSNAGCEPEDFTGFTAGNVALVQRGTCDFAVKVENAVAAGASAVILFNEGQPGRTDADPVTLGGPVTVPVVFASFALGSELAGQVAAGEDVQVHLTTDTLSEERSTWNVLADSRRGRDDRTVVVGAHLDSVTEGPGINDNGTGTATVLELAQEMAETHTSTPNTVRFAFWGAEEAGLLGSTEYVATLPPEELADIALNLNFDMVGSPNPVRFVYDGDGDATGTAGPAGSDQIEAVFEQFFGSQGLATAPTAFDGRSDYGPFIDVGIPAGGLFTGAEGIKTEEEAATFGGTAGVAYDPCYHADCDTNANIDPTVLDQMADAVAHSTWVFSRHSLPPREAADADVATTLSAEAAPQAAVHGEAQVAAA
jgi:Zn-dependent M28 family amino/carboxypeptidase